MRIFLAGATGVIGRHLVPLLVAAGHEVAGMTRTAAKAPALAANGVQPVVCDVYDADALAAAVDDFRPDLVMHQLTDLPDEPTAIPAFATRNARIRTEGTRNLLSAAQDAGAARFVAQSIAWVPSGGEAALEEFEHMVLRAGGVVIRYGAFYGPDTYHSTDLPPHPRVHVAEAASQTVALLESPSRVVVVADDPERASSPPTSPT